MWRVIFRFGFIVALAVGFVWLVERPGSVTIDWFDHRVELPLVAALALLILAFAVLASLWWLMRRLVRMPRALAGRFHGRRERKGYAALTRGIVAVGAGDVATASRFAEQAHRALPDDPLARLLKAQAAQLQGDQGTVQRIFVDMLQSPETEVLALRGLFTQARQNGDMVRARVLAEKALALKPNLPWASNAMLAIRSAEQDWPAAAAIVEGQRRAGLIPGREADRRHAAVLAAQAIAREVTAPAEALDLALKAQKLAPDLAPAALVAGRILASRGEVRKSLKVLQRGWAALPHPEIAEAYAHARIGDAPRERLERVRDLVARRPGGEEGAVALARAAVEARDWPLARTTLAPFLAERPPARVCALMAEIEEGESGDKGRAREWLARAVHAPRDPAWVAAGYVSDVWLPASPATGELGVFEWKRPPEHIARLEPPKAARLAGRGGDSGFPRQPAAAIDAETAPAAPPADEPAKITFSPPVQAKLPAVAAAEDPARPVTAGAAPVPRQPDDPGPEHAGNGAAPR